MSYYANGQESGTTANDTAKFGTYTRDAATGLDYAMNRYYQSTWGRFTSPDPYRASGGPGDPGSWNRYSYVQGDPVNLMDTAGLQAQRPYPPGYCPAEYDAWECTTLGFFASGSMDGGGGGGGGYDACQTGPGFLPRPGCMMPIIIARPPTPPPPDFKGLYETLEITYITGYLARYNSPLAPHASEIFYSSEAFGLDYRFIVALAGVESGYGKYLGWGPFNAWNSIAHRSPESQYANWSEAIQDTIKNLNSARYSSFNCTVEIYSIWEQGDVKKPSPGQSNLDKIYVGQLGGDLNNVRQPRCVGLE